MKGDVFFVSWRGIPAPPDQTYMVARAQPGCKIESSQRRPFGFTVIEVADITQGVCPSCHVKTTLHAGVCEWCRVVGECGS